MFIALELRFPVLDSWMTGIGPGERRFGTWSPTNSPPRKVKTGAHLIRHGGEPSHATLVWKYAAPNGGFASAGRIDAAARRNQSGRRRGVEEGVPDK